MGPRLHWVGENENALREKGNVSLDVAIINILVNKMCLKMLLLEEYLHT